MYEFVRGPLVWVSFLIFLGGIIFRVIQFFILSKKREQNVSPPPNKYGGLSPEEQRIHLIASLKNSVLGTYPAVTIATSLFHFFLFFIPLFLLAHNNLLFESWGIRLWALSEETGDFLTVIFLGLGVFFLIRRLVVPKVRALTTAYDYLVLLITGAPFLTGFIAYHQWFNYHTVLVIHIITGELMLIAITFTKLGHMIFFFLARFFIGKEYSLGRGSRTW